MAVFFPNEPLIEEPRSEDLVTPCAKCTPFSPAFVVMVRFSRWM